MPASAPTTRHLQLHHTHHVQINCPPPTAAPELTRDAPPRQPFSDLYAFQRSHQSDTVTYITSLPSNERAELFACLGRKASRIILSPPSAMPAGGEILFAAASMAIYAHRLQTRPIDGDKEVVGLALEKAKQEGWGTEIKEEMIKNAGNLKSESIRKIFLDQVYGYTVWVDEDKEGRMRDWEHDPRNRELWVRILGDESLR